MFNKANNLGGLETGHMENFVYLSGDSAGQEISCDGEITQVEAEEGPHLRIEQRWGPLQG